MRVNGLEVDATPEQIIQQLQMQVEAEQGRTLFRRTKSLGMNLQFTCPFHANGLEKNPSCGMSREPSYRGSKVTEAGTVHCFTCGYTAPLPRFISDVLNNARGVFYGTQWLKQHFSSGETITRNPIELNFSRGKQKNKREVFEAIPEEELDKYRWVHPYMFKRKLNIELIEMFDVGYDKLHDSLTFPVRDMEGRTIFINRRSVTTKFHHYGENDPKTEFLYGEYELSIYPDYFEGNQGVLYVVESIINCLTLWRLKIPAVALMGVGGGSQVELLKQMPQRTIVLALDPDDAGSEAQLRLHAQLSKHKIVQFLDYPQYMWDEKLDINDEAENINFLQTYL